jgi:spoIIIJ-associated protein
MMLNQEQTDFAVSLLAEMIDSLGLDTEISAKNDEENDNTVLYLKSSESGRLIGRKGRTLESLEYLLGRALSQKFEGAYFAVLDVDGYQKRRRGGGGSRREKPSGDSPATSSDSPRTSSGDGVDENRLQRIADEAVKEVRRWGEPHSIGPFKPAERKVIHTALSAENGIVGESGADEGHGLKKITVRMADAEE